MPSSNHFFQKEGRNNTRIVNNSKRPRIISKDKRTLAAGVIQEKVILGPIFPKPGPMLLKQETEVETAVAKFISGRGQNTGIRNANNRKVQKNNTPNPTVR